MGVPVVSTSISGIPELVRDGETGVLVPPRDDEALAQGIARLLSDSNLRLRLAQSGKQRVCEEFDLSINAQTPPSRSVFETVVHENHIHLCRLRYPRARQQGSSVHVRENRQRVHASGT